MAINRAFFVKFVKSVAAALFSEQSTRAAFIDIIALLRLLDFHP
jgi:hypothetical protein